MVAAGVTGLVGLMLDIPEVQILFGSLLLC